MELKKNDKVLSKSKFYVLNAVRGNSNAYLKIISGIKKVLQENRYDAVVVNTSIVAVELACLIAAKMTNTPCIVHAHNTDLILGKGAWRTKHKFITSVADSVGRLIVRNQAQLLFACSEDAGIKTFGKRAIQREKFSIIHNAIEVERFAYSESKRKNLREQMHIDEKKVIYGNVGSFCKRKNQGFLIDLFEEVIKVKPDSELWLIGDGEYRERLRDKVDKLGLNEKVRFWGQRDDVDVLMQGMDCFVFTTLSEGLGIVAIEAQTAGLSTIVSDGVPKDVLVSNLCRQISLSAGKQEWVTAMTVKVGMKREDMSSVVAEAGFSIEREAIKMTNLLLNSL